MKLQIISNEGIVVTEFNHIDKLDLSRDVDGWRVLGFVRAVKAHLINRSFSFRNYPRSKQ